VFSGARGAPRGYETIAPVVELDRLNRSRARFPVAHVAARALITGNHPEYPSGHACGTAALTQSLRSYFGTKHVELVMSSTALGAGPPRTR
jgi:hypothetical protein